MFDRAGGFAFVQLDTDGYVGYVREDALQDHVVQTTHRVSVLLIASLSFCQHQDPACHCGATECTCGFAFA